MPKSKNHRGKKHNKNCVREVVPSYLYNFAPPVTEDSIKQFEDMAYTSLNLLRMGTWDDGVRANLRFVLRHYWAFAKSFNDSDAHQVLAVMGTAATQALGSLFDDGRRENKQVKPEYVTALIEPISQAVTTYFAMMRQLSRAEMEFARRQAERRNLTLGAKQAAVGGCWLVDPKAGEVEALRGFEGMAYVHQRCEPGFLDVRGEDEKIYVWAMPHRDSFIKVEKPTLVFLTEKEPSHRS